MDEEFKKIVEAKIAKYTSENNSLLKLGEEHQKQFQESQQALNNINLAMLKNNERIAELNELIETS
jgi:hypothetical protein